MTTLIQQYLWVFPVSLTVLIWMIVFLLPYKFTEQDGGFECHPMFEVSSRVTIAGAISIFIWLAFVAIAVKV